MIGPNVLRLLCGKVLSLEGSKLGSGRSCGFLCASEFIVVGVSSIPVVAHVPVKSIKSSILPVQSVFKGCSLDAE